MKTTSGKIYNPRRNARSVRIHKAPPDGGRVAIFYARTLRSGLEKFFKEHLKSRGYKKPNYVGNVLQCVNPDGETVEYVAYEEEVKKK